VCSERSVLSPRIGRNNDRGSSARCSDAYVGLFWRDVLGWQLVWDDDEGTAIQSPCGGTEVSWGGLPVAPEPGRLVTDDLLAEVERLIAHGATQLGNRDFDIELLDPDGNEFCMRSA
jgi:Glyoxalase-like domain